MVGNYRLIRRLGQGGTSSVWQAQDQSGGKVALKMLHPAIATDQEARERLTREANAINRVRSEGVANIIDIETEGSEAFIVTELIDGQTLAQDVSENGPWDLEDLVDLAQSLAHTLQLLHAAKVVHRDLKPANVMVSQRGPVLIDFGIASVKGADRLTDTGLVSGTPGYLCPEVLAGKEPDEAADWWALAAVLLFCSTGRPPFGTGPTEAVLARVSSGGCQCVGANPQVAAILQRALNPDPALRPDPQTWLSQLRQLSEGVPDSHQAVTTWMPQDAAPTVAVETHPSDPAPPSFPPEIPIASPPPDQELEQIPEPPRPAPISGMEWEDLEVKDYVAPLAPMAPLTGLVLTALAAFVFPFWPVAVVATWAAFLVIFHLVGAVRRQVAKDNSSNVKIWLKSPLTLLIAVISEVVSAALGLGVAALGYWIYRTSQGPFTWAQLLETPSEYSHKIAMAICFAAAIIISWWLPFSSTAREGARGSLRAILPGKFARFVFFFFLSAASAGTFIALWLAR